jgi:ferrochelatase
MPPLLRQLFARFTAQHRAAESRRAYQQIGGRSPIAEESAAQAAAVAAELAARGLPARPYVAMACWHPFAEETVRDMMAHGVRRAVALPLYPHYSRSTTGASAEKLARAINRAHADVDVALVERYPAAEGYIEALADRAREAMATLPPAERQRAPVLFSAHGLPEAYIRRGDPYLDDIRLTVETVKRRLGLPPGRGHLCFQSRVGRSRWLEPETLDLLLALAREGARAVVVVPVAFTGEHLETLQEIDIVFRQRAEAAGIAHFARARTVGCHPAFVRALADLALGAARARGWA